MVELGGMDPEDEALVRRMVKKHVTYTGSRRASEMLDAWHEMAPRFVKVMPTDYQRMLETLAWVEKTGLTGEKAEMAAFEANKADARRVSGN
jgi:glutamate synthase (ferredoxin)